MRPEAIVRASPWANLESWALRELVPSIMSLWSRRNDVNVESIA
jgi:hypothetical protein